MKPQRVFITGGASGLGRELALCYARAGASVLIGDIDAERGAAIIKDLQQTGVKAHYVPCDVRQEGDIECAAVWLRANWGGVDIVINNAGVAQMGPIADISLDDWQWVVDINLLGVVRGCKVFTPMLREQAGGKIVNVASMAGLLYLPKAAAYNATKAAVVALSETLQLELAADNIQVTVACPAFFRTDLAKHMRASDAESERFTKRLVERARVGPEEIAGKIFDGVARGETHILTHADSRKAWRMKRYLPYAWYLSLIRRQVARIEARMQKRKEVAV
ncbi:SDR family oxidoreductase [Paraburkholderia sp. UYCP14C]|uniref:SDR family oxidoreductase n=1 Tax=Paraburkholderia sp. UYCP14C TaxID=2511130 RepID=UPI0010220265|nr:SDR family oxidoreductase [Paraburkholderia sp. UYCP14C]RZF25422.1 SDR family oxidoreductase [Paraburkholderia sp. UYCP14C]